MRILVSGVCGFVGSTIANGLIANVSNREIVGIDNLSRGGSQVNLEPLRKRGIAVRHADLRCASDLETIGKIDWIIDAAANPSVLAGVDGSTSSRQLLEHNLYGTVNLLEVAKKNRAGFTLLSTSRVYSVKALSEIPVVVKDAAFTPEPAVSLPNGATERGIAENFSTAPPVSLYGASKVASESIALEYGEAFDFPVWINRCGVLAGAGQFGHAEQGIFSFWINAWLRRRPLKYIGFDGAGHQCRDCFHPRDLLTLLEKQFEGVDSNKPRIVNLGGGVENAMSLAQLSRWCEARFGSHHVAPDTAPRQFDVPWLVMDSRLAEKAWAWRPTTKLQPILEEIAQHAEANPEWLELSSIR
jgi:CDP-paratose 2-epimerase